MISFILDTINYHTCCCTVFIISNAYSLVSFSTNAYIHWGNISSLVGNIFSNDCSLFSELIGGNRHILL
jgi:hypothetical protein